MPTGIDLSSDVLRISKLTDAGPTCKEHFGVVGVQARMNEPIVWSRPRTLRTSLQGPYLSLTSAWQAFQEDYRSTVTPKGLNGKSPPLESTKAIVQAASAHVDNLHSELFVFAVDNTISEFHQGALLRALGSYGFGNRELLWRPIAVVLDHLVRYGSHECNEGDSILVVDLESYVPELTVLELKSHRGELIPLRSLPENKRPGQSKPYTGFSDYNLKREALKLFSGGKRDILRQLSEGPFSSEFFSFLELQEKQEVWIRSGLDHEVLELDEHRISGLAQAVISGKSFRQFEELVNQAADERSLTTILWNGFPSRIQPDPPSGNVVDRCSVSLGAMEYAKRRKQGLPTYLDTLSGLEIMSKDSEKGTQVFYPLIEPGVVEGGETASTPEPVTQFALEKDAQEFTSVLRDPTNEACKKIVTILPPIEFKEHVPLILTAKIQPGQGHAEVRLEGASGYESIFGRQH